MNLDGKKLGQDFNAMQTVLEWDAESAECQAFMKKCGDNLFAAMENRRGESHLDVYTESFWKKVDMAYVENLQKLVVMPRMRTWTDEEEELADRNFNQYIDDVLEAADEICALAPEDVQGSDRFIIKKTLKPRLI